jgi:hypothetical protein
MGFGELELCLPSPIFGRGAGGEGKDLILHSDAPNKSAVKGDFQKCDVCIEQYSISDEALFLAPFCRFQFFRSCCLFLITIPLLNITGTPSILEEFLVDASVYLWNACIAIVFTPWFYQVRWCSPS